MESIPCFQKRATSSQMIRKATLFGKKVCQCHTAYQHIYFLVRVTLTCGAHPKLLRLRIEKFRGSSRRQPSNVKAGRHQCTSHNDLMQRIMFQSNSCHQWLSKMACLWKSRLRRSLKTNVAVQVKSRFVPHRKACPSLVGNNPTWNDSKWTHVIFQGSFTWPGTSLATWTRNFREHVENNPSCSQKKKTHRSQPQALANAQRIQSKWEKDGSVLCCSYQDLPAVGSMKKIVYDAAREDVSHPDLYCSFSLSIGLQKVDLNKADPPMRHKMHPVPVVPDSKRLANGGWCGCFGILLLPNGEPLYFGDNIHLHTY